MLGDLSGPALLAIIAVLLLVIAAAVAGLIFWAVKRSNRARSEDLQRAYDAGRAQNGPQV